jgi:hypothetical protein
MAVEFKIKIENNGITITQVVEPVTSQVTVRSAAQGGVLKSNHLRASFASGSGGGGNAETGPGGGGNAETGPGGGGNAETGPGGGGNAETGPGGGGNAETGPGGGGNAETGPGGGAAGTAPRQPSSNSFFQMETQGESEWCWAAVSASVDHYFQPESSLTQCQVATEVIGDECCAVPDPYNEPEMLDTALTVVGRLGDTTGPLTFEELQSEIDAKRPVCIRIAWDDGGAHFVALSGYQVLSSGARTVDVADPFYPDSTEDFDLFPSYYHGGGEWTATFLTKQKKGDPKC